MEKNNADLKEGRYMFLIAQNINMLPFWWYCYNGIMNKKGNLLGKLSKTV